MHLTLVLSISYFDTAVSSILDHVISNAPFNRTWYEMRLFILTVLWFKFTSTPGSSVSNGQTVGRFG